MNTKARRLFSEIHQKALMAKRLRLSMKRELRASLLRLMTRFSKWGGWDNDENETFQVIKSKILDRRGWQELKWWEGKEEHIAPSLDDFIEKTPVHYVLDAIQLFAEWLHRDQASTFIDNLNATFEIHHSPIRFFNGEFYIIDSIFLESQVLSQAQQLLEANQFQGALQEFQESRKCWLDKDFKGVIFQANKALESSMKAVLGDKAPTKTRDIIKCICHGGFMPCYYEGFLASFYDILSIVPITRDNEAGHGQGKEIRDIPPSLAELCLHMSGALIVCLIKRYMQMNPSKSPPKPKEVKDEIPF